MLNLVGEGMSKPASLRTEIRAILEQAKLAGKPIEAQVIWGLLSFDASRDALANLLSLMVRDKQVVRTPGTGTGPGNPGTYEPGPVPVGNTRDSVSSFMGFREHSRLVDARKAARAWLKQGATR